MFRSLDGRLAKRRGRRLEIESLEDRQVMTSIAVPNYYVGESLGKVLQNSGPVALPEAYWAIDGITVSPEHGTIQRSADQKSWLYTPAPGFEGIDPFTYRTHLPENMFLIDPVVQFDQAYTLRLMPAAEPQAVEQVGRIEVIAPFAAVPDWFLVTPNAPSATLDVLANDRWNHFKNEQLLGSDKLPSRPSLSVVASTASKHGGQISLSDDHKSLIYKPAAGFEGLDEFEYTVTDANGITRTARVQVRVAATPPGTDPALPRWEDEFEYRMLMIGLEEAAKSWQPTLGYIEGGVPRALSSDNLFLTAASTTNDSAAFTSANRTVTQETGVDEADLIETDGRFVYWIATRMVDNHEVHTLTIMDGQAVDGQSAILSQTTLAERPLAIFLHNHRLTVISTSEQYAPFYSDVFFYPNNGVYEQNATVTVYDVANPMDPEVLERSEVDGTYQDSRMIDGRLYLFVNQVGTNWMTAMNPRWIQRANNVYSSLENVDEYIERMESLDLKRPAVVSQWGTEGPSVRTELISQVFTINEYGGLVSPESNAIVVFDTTDQAAGASSHVSRATAPETIYSTDESFYVTVHEYDYSTFTGYSTIHAVIDKYDLSDNGLALTLEASGQVPGRIQSRFSIDEQDDILRVATTVDAWMDPESAGTGVYTLATHGDKLDVIGSVTKLSPNESLFSATFIGDRAYLVTFLRRDPLHVIDLSDPAKPTQLAELVVPGYSDHLIPISEDLILGIGRNTDTNGLASDLQVSLFNVHDPAHPVAVAQQNIEGGSATIVTGMNQGWAWNAIDPHAVRYYEGLGILALPLQDLTTGTHRLELLKIRPTGIEKAGDISFGTDQVQRSLLIDDEMLALSPSVVKKFDPNDLAAITTIDLTAGIAHVEKLAAVSVSATTDKESMVASGQWTWQNTASPLDVNGDGQVSPIDMLLTITELSRSENLPLQVDAVWQQSALERNELWHVDVNDDGYVSPLDAMLIAEELNRKKK